MINPSNHLLPCKSVVAAALCRRTPGRFAPFDSLLPTRQRFGLRWCSTAFRSRGGVTAVRSTNGSFLHTVTNTRRRLSTFPTVSRSQIACFGLRWQAQRDTALGTSVTRNSITPCPAKAPSPLHSAGALQNAPATASHFIARAIEFHQRSCSSVNSHANSPPDVLIFSMVPPTNPSFTAGISRILACPRTLAA